MSDFETNFISHLLRLKERDSGALARLKRSLAHDPGNDPSVYPYVEPFVGTDWHAQDSRRIALYLVAGLFAINPHHLGGRSLAEAFGSVARARVSGSLELRFMTVLGADSDQLPTLLRQIVCLLDGETYDHARLLNDLQTLLSPFSSDWRDRIRHQWATDFYRNYTPSTR